MMIFRVSTPVVCGSWCRGFDHDLLCGDCDDHVEVVGGAYGSDGRLVRAISAGQEHDLVVSVAALDVWDAGCDVTLSQLRRAVVDALSVLAGVTGPGVCVTDFGNSDIPEPEIFLDTNNITRSLQNAS